MENNNTNGATPGSSTKTPRRLSFEDRLRKINEEIANTPPPTAEQLAEQSRRRERAEHVKRSANVDALLRAAGARYRDATVDNFTVEESGQADAVAACREWVSEVSDNPSQGLLLFGPVGTGKDHLAIGAARDAIMQHDLDARFVNGADLFAQMRDAIDGKESEERVIARLVSPRLLILSDPLPVFGALTSYQSQTLYRVANGRYSRGASTITTINVANSEEAIERMGAATWDRLKAEAVVVYCNWPSHRKPTRTVNC